MTDDFNGDGKPDLAATFGDNLAGGRAPAHGADRNRRREIHIVDLALSFVLIAAVDVNRDTKADIIAAAPFGGASLVLLGNGDGSFQPPRIVAAGVLRVADFNGDGKLDVAHTSAWHDAFGMVWIWLGSGDGTFSPAAAQ